MIHIHNGDIVADRARSLAIPGEHLPFRESLVSGRVEFEPSLEVRAAAVSRLAGRDVRDELAAQNAALEAACGHDEIVLWFEHDLYCLVHFVYLLQRLGRRDARPPELSFVWHPEPLAGADDLLRLFDSRRRVTPAMLDVAAQVWRDYTSPDARDLNRWLDDRAFPFLAEAVALHGGRFAGGPFASDMAAGNIARYGFGPDVVTGGWLGGAREEEYAWDASRRRIVASR